MYIIWWEEVPYGIIALLEHPSPAAIWVFKIFEKKGGVPHFSLKKGGVGKIGVGGGGKEVVLKKGWYHSFSY